MHHSLMSKSHTMLTNCVLMLHNAWAKRTSNSKNLVKIWFLWWILSYLCIYVFIVYVVSNTYEFLLAVSTGQQYDGDTNNIFTWYSSSIRWISLKISITDLWVLFFIFLTCFSTAGQQEWHWAAKKPAPQVLCWRGDSLQANTEYPVTQERRLEKLSSTWCFISHFQIWKIWHTFAFVIPINTVKSTLQIKEQ